jgi:tetratricopeptide (TPR) repeat protein
VDKPRVKEIAAKLATAGIDPWVDQWEIQPGDDLVARINEGLATYDVGLLFLSKTSLESGWVTAEVSTLIYQMIEDGKRVIPVMIEAGAPVPPLLRPRARLGFDQVDELISAIYGRSDKPAVAPPRIRTRERSFRIVLRSAEPGKVAVLAELDGQTVAPEQETRLGTDFAFSYQDFLQARFPATQRSPAAAAVQMREAELARLGDAVGRVVFPPPVADALAALLAEAQAGNEAVLLAFEAADPMLLSIPFEAARIPGGRLPALEPGVRVLRRHLGTRVAQGAGPLPGPLRILVAVGAPDEDKTKNTVLDLELELQTILDAVDTARRYGNAEVDILEVGNPDQIQDALLAGSYHVLHLSGHGKAGSMELETEDGEPLPVLANELADAIRAAHEPLPLVVLATCHGGVSANDTVSFAQGLLERGIPMVLAMQSTVSDWYATRLAGAFYGNLARRDVRFPSHALALARQEVEKERHTALREGMEGAISFPEYATPALFCAGDEILLLDWEADQIAMPRRAAQPPAGPVPLLKVGDLIGRRKELRKLLRILLDDPRAVVEHGQKAGAVLTGIGGVGKSALAGRAMSRLAERGWRLAAVEGRWTIGELATRVGASLIADEDRSIQRIAGLLVQPTLDDKARLQLLSQLLAAHEVLIVLDNFEDNLTMAGTDFLDASTGPILKELARSSSRGKILVTSRYPVPGSEPWLVPLPLGPLSPAQTRKLLYRLTELKDRPPAALGRILRLIGGHPRVLEYLDAILHRGTGRLSIVEEKLRENVNLLGLRVEDLGGDLEQSLQDAIRIGAQDIFLDELIETALGEPEHREVLEQASVFPTPIDIRGLAFALSGAQEPSAERINEVRGIAGKLARTSLLTPLNDDSVWVHRWTAEALKGRMEDRVQEHCRRAGECLVWKIENRMASASDPAEAVRLLLQGAEFEKATTWARALVKLMNNYGQSLAALSLIEDVLSGLPGYHEEFPNFLREAGNALFTLGLAEVARERYTQSLQLGERLAAAEPSRADHQNDLSLSYERMGNLLRALGEGDKAKDFYEKSLLLREPLAAAEPDNAGYQRNLSVSYSKMGDLFQALGKGEQAKEYHQKDLAIAKHLAASEPDSAEYQRDLAISYSRMGDLLRVLGEGNQAKLYYQQDLAITKGLAASEPDSAEYQRDLSISYIRMGDLLGVLGEGDQAKEYYQKDLAIAERLAAAEPNRADYQTDLVASLVRVVEHEPEKGRSMHLRALSILEALKARGTLLPMYEPWLNALRQAVEL